MMSRSPGRAPLRLAVLPLICLLAVCGGAAAQDSARGWWSCQPRQLEWYIGAAVVHNRLPGGFDGTSLFTGSDIVVEIPAIEPATGWGLVAGIKGALTGALAAGIDFSYSQSRHRGSWLTLPRTVTCSLLNMDLRLYALPGLRVQPYAQVGLCVPTVNAGESYVTYLGSVGARYGGIGVNLGGGLLLCASRRIALHGGAVYRSLSFGGVGNGIDSPARLDRSIASKAVDIECGATYRFGR